MNLLKDFHAILLLTTVCNMHQGDEITSEGCSMKILESATLEGEYKKWLCPLM